MEQGSRLYVWEAGPQEAEEIVFLHGGGAGGWTWRPVIERLYDYRCLAPDLPQHGRSAQVGPFSIETAAAEVAALIRTRSRIGKAHVVGLSEGAQVLVKLLAAYPELVDRAVVSSALLEPLPGAGLLTPTMLRLLYRTSMAPFKNWDGWIRLNMKYAVGIPAAYFAEFKKDFQSTTESAFVNLMQANLGFRLPAGLEKVNVPTLVIVGSREYAAMHRSARRLAAALPEAQAHRVSLGSEASLAQEHNWAMNDPDLFAGTVRAWIEGGRLPGRLSDPV